jgi:CRP-like cAMP-binding protein
MEYFKTKISLTERELYELAQSLELVYLDSGEYIMRQGDIGDNCYIILDGEVSIQIENAKKKEILFKEADAMRLSEH